MKLIALLFSVITLYGASEFSVNKATYASEFSETSAQVPVQSARAKEIPISHKSQNAENTSRQNKVKKEQQAKQKLNGYQRAKRIYGEKIVEVSTIGEAKKLAKSRNDLVTFEKVKSTTVSSRLSDTFEKSSFVIMMKVDKRGDGEIIYNIYFFKKV